MTINMSRMQQPSKKRRKESKAIIPIDEWHANDRQELSESD